MKQSKVPESNDANRAISDNHQWAANHKMAASHFTDAATSHLAAAKYHEIGEHEKAIKCTVEAHGHASLAMEVQREDVKHFRVEA